MCAFTELFATVMKDSGILEEGAVFTSPFHISVLFSFPSGPPFRPYLSPVIHSYHVRTLVDHVKFSATLCVSITSM